MKQVIGLAVAVYVAGSLWVGAGALSTRTPADINHPPIGTEEYSAGCVIEQAWEDGSAIAYCPEDGVRYVFDPDGQFVPGIANNPVRGIGWYVMEEGE